MQGGSGNDRLSGAAGADSLTGGSGQDVFQFDSAPRVGMADIVSDFQHGIDQIWISLAPFDPNGRLGLSAASLTSQATPFIANSTGEANQAGAAQTVYDTGAGRLFWDADGRGGAAGVLVAIFQGAPQITALDVSFLM